jgi:hypothetical protein
MPKKLFPYNQQGFEARYPWVWTWNVPRSKGTGTPYKVSVRTMVDTDGKTITLWGCDCTAGRNGAASCQHRMRVQYDLVTVPGMLLGIPAHVREIAAPNLVAVSTSGREIQPEGMRGLKVVL